MFCKALKFFFKCHSLFYFREPKLLSFGTQTKSVIPVQRRYRQFFKTAAPNHRTTVKSVAKFSMGAVCNVNKGHDMSAHVSGSEQTELPILGD